MRKYRYVAGMLERANVIVSHLLQRPRKRHGRLGFEEETRPRLVRCAPLEIRRAALGTWRYFEGMDLQSPAMGMSGAGSTPKTVVRTTKICHNTETVNPTKDIYVIYLCLP